MGVRCSTQVDDALKLSTSTAHHNLILPSKPNVQMWHNSSMISEQSAKSQITTTMCVLHFVLQFFLLIKCALIRIILLCCEKMPPPKQDRHAPGPTGWTSTLPTNYGE